MALAVLWGRRLVVSSPLAERGPPEVSHMSTQLVYALNWIESLLDTIGLSLYPRIWCINRTMT